VEEVMLGAVTPWLRRTQGIRFHKEEYGAVYEGSFYSVIGRGLFIKRKVGIWRIKKERKFKG